jgi:hypothetical protein
MIFDIQRPRGQNPAIIILHAKNPAPNDRLLSIDFFPSTDLDDAILGDQRLVFEAALNLCSLLH